MYTANLVYLTAFRHLPWRYFYTSHLHWQFTSHNTCKELISSAFEDGDFKAYKLPEILPIFQTRYTLTPATAVSEFYSLICERLYATKVSVYRSFCQFYFYNRSFILLCILADHDSLKKACMQNNTGWLCKSC